jgi:hypothetical protein
MNMKKIDQVITVKGEALILQICMHSADTAESVVAQDEYENLVERFFSDHSVLVSAEQLPDAKKNVDYFVSLLDSAIRFYSSHDKK